MDPRVQQRITPEFKGKAEKVVKSCHCDCKHEKKESRVKAFY